ncbi:MAG: cytochrome c oxidase assembly protein [Acidimicrobiales bacterium]|nr:cytochrome c oxidase assembly protein [Acidimicrobiales bacterium]
MHRISTSDILFGWHFDLLSTIVLVLSVVAYARGVQRFAAQHGRRWPLRRIVWFGFSMLTLLIATQSGIGRYDDERMSIHMAQHLLLGMVAPLALVRAAPVTLALQAGSPVVRRIARCALHSRAVRFLTRPVVTWLLFGGGMVAVYLTPILGLSARNEVVHVLVHVHLFTSGSLFLVGLVGVDRLPHPIPYGARLLVTLTAVPFHAVLGIVLLTASSPAAPDVYPSLSDQRTAGGLLWMMGELFSVVVAGFVVVEWFRSEQRAAARFDRSTAATAGATAGES